MIGAIFTFADIADAYVLGVSSCGTGFSLDSVVLSGVCSGCDDGSTLFVVSYGSLLRTYFPNESCFVRAKHCFR